MISPKDQGPGEDYDSAQHPVRNAFFRLLAGVIGIVCLWMLWIDEAAFAKSDFTALGRAVLFIPMGLLFLVFAFGGYAGIEWFDDLIRRRLLKVSGETVSRKIHNLRSDDCFCQFKIDQARQLNFDQGLKPVF